MLKSLSEGRLLHVIDVFWVAWWCSQVDSGICQVFISAAVTEQWPKGSDAVGAWQHTAELMTNVTCVQTMISSSPYTLPTSNGRPLLNCGL